VQSGAAIAVDPTIANCIITRNSAETDGGGVVCSSYSSPLIINCSISANTCGREGGGIHCGVESSPLIMNCLITNNSAGNGWCGNLLRAR